jgi:hypothetical protein
MKITRLIFAVSAVLIFISYLAYAQQSHPADEITPGTFTAGWYIFQGNLNFTNQPRNQITIVPTVLTPEHPEYSIFRIRNTSDTTNLIEFRKGGDIITKANLYAERIGIGLDPWQTPKYSLDIPNGDIEVKNISITGSETPNIGFQGETGYINTKPIGNISIGSGIWGNISNVIIGGKLICNDTVGIGTNNPSDNVGLDVKNSEPGSNRGQIIADTYLFRNATCFAFIPLSTAGWIDVCDDNMNINLRKSIAGKGINFLIPGGLSYSARMSIMSDGNVGINTTNPTARLDIAGLTGYNQLRVRTSYTPSGSADTNGSIGDIAWDDNYIYVKTNLGWKRATLISW